MTKEQAERLDAAIAKSGLNWWEVSAKIGDLTNQDAVQAAIEVIEKMGETK